MSRTIRNIYPQREKEICEIEVVGKITNILHYYTRISLVWRIVIGMIIGAILGLILPSWTFIGILGNMFVSALKAIAPLLVAVLVTALIAQAGEGHGRRFAMLISMYLLSTFIAALTAVVGSRLFPVTLQLVDAEIQDNTVGSLSEVFSHLLIGMLENPVSALADANYVAILLWSTLIGLAFRSLASENTIATLHELSDIISKVVRWIIQLAPFGILGLVFTAVSENGLIIFTTYGRLLLLLVSCMALTALVLNPLIAFLFTRRNPYPLLFTCLKESGLSAFFTRSSAANIPVNMSLSKRLGLDEEFYSVSIPLGATINMSGAAVTITVFSLAVANTMGVEVSVPSAIFLSLIATFAACGTSGIAGGSLLLIPLACSFFGIGNDVAMQAVAVGFIIGVVQDSVETALNSSSDVFFTAVAEQYHIQKKRNLKH